MTDNEIIKALECCSTNNQKCMECPLDLNCMMGVPSKNISRAAIGLIHRQQEELKKYKQTITFLQGLVEVWKAVRKNDI